MEFEQSTVYLNMEYLDKTFSQFKAFAFTTLFLSVFCVHSLLAQDTASVLFIGNSLTGANNLPNVTKDIANSTGDVLIVDWSTPGGYQLSQHATYAPTLSKINSRNWDFVAIQGQSQEFSWSDGQMTSQIYPAATRLVDSIRANNSCTTPIFYMTWGWKNGDTSPNCGFIPWVCTYQGMDSAISVHYQTIATQTQSLVAPAGVVWNHIQNNYPGLNLYSDHVHPTTTGTYMVGCVFYTMMLQKDPTLITYNYSLSAADADTIKSIVKSLVFDHLEDWNIDEYPTYLSNFTTMQDCDSVLLNGNWFTRDSTFTDTIQSQYAWGCDTINDFAVNIGEFYQKSIVSTCETYDFGGNLIDSSGSYIDSFLTNQGCDSILELDITFFQIDSTLDLTTESLSSNELNADAFQWLDCSTNMTAISNENAISFAPTSNGQYAVQIDRSGCIDTSDCVDFMVNGISIDAGNKGIKVLSNPDGTIQVSNLHVGSKITLMDAAGHTISVFETTSEPMFTLKTSYSISSGIYFLYIQQGPNLSPVVRRIGIF